MNLNKQQLNTIKAWFTPKTMPKIIATSNKTLALLNEELDLQLDFSGKEIPFNSSLKRKIESGLKQYNYPSPNSDEFAQERTRVEQAKTANNEKNGSIAVNEHQILIASPSGRLLINQQNIDIGKTLLGSKLHLDFRLISSIQASAIVIVENEIIMSHLHQLSLPAELNDALFVFRGSADLSKGIKACHAFIERWRSYVVIIGFYDLDISGLSMLNKLAPKQVLLPPQELWPEIFSKHWQGLRGLDKRLLDQQAFYGNLQRTMTSEIGLALLKQIAQKQQTRTQEHLLSHQVPLHLYCF